MAILWDAPLAAAVARELHDRLRGERLRAHRFRWGERELTLWLRGATLVWSLHPGAGWVVLLPASDPPADARPLSADVEGVEAPPDERVVRTRLRRRRGSPRELELVVELMTNQWNALLLEGEARRIRHLLWTRRTGERPLAVGQAYTPPPPSTRAGKEGPLDPGSWEALVRTRSEDGDGRALLEILAFTSPLNLPAILAGAGRERPHGPAQVGPQLRGQEGGIPSGFPLWEKLRTLEDPRPCLLETARGNQPYPYPIQGLRSNDLPSVLEAMAYVAGEAGPSGADPREDVLERLEQGIRRARRRIQGLEREAAAGGDPIAHRSRADLLLARLREVPKGSARVTLTGFDGAPVELALDPSLSPRENAEALYREAARLEKARARIPPLLERARGRMEELERLRDGVAAGTVAAQEAAVRLPEERAGGASAHGSVGPRLPYRAYRSSGGLEIRVGRGPADNDQLTFRHARPQDVWLHARDVAGAHVILRWEGPGNPPARDLQEAAVLAALGSRARSSGTVPVDWTLRKHVRKPRKAPPGAVVPERVQTLFVRPDPELPERLRGEDQSR